MLIEADLTKAPDQMQSIPSAIYKFRIVEVAEKSPKQKPDGTVADGMNIVLSLEIIDHEEQAGRKKDLYVFIPRVAKRDDAYTQIKRIFLSAGIPVTGSGMNTNDLLGKVITAEVREEIYENPVTKMKSKSANIATIFIPSDNVQASSNAATPAAPADLSSVLGGASVPQATPAPAVPAIPAEAIAAGKA
jgi:hypothetical protein